jgi:hypothetical protein
MNQRMKDDFDKLFKIDMKSLKTGQNKRAASVRMRKERLARGDDYCKNFVVGKNEEAKK